MCLVATQASVEAAVAANPDKFVVASVGWTGGTEQMLDEIQQYFDKLHQQIGDSRKAPIPNNAASRGS